METNKKNPAAASDLKTNVAAQPVELTVDDLEQVAGGGAATSTSKSKTADKAFQAMDGYIRG